ncbi:MAG: hypothetical protein AAEJ04_00930, partial [Planctomycetota bacterium]
MTMPLENESSDESVNRRQVLKGVAGAAFLAGVTNPAAAMEHAASTTVASLKKSKIKQSVAHWCFSEHWSVEQT